MQGKIGAVHHRAKPHDLAPEIRRELLKLALKNARKSVVLLLLAGWFVAWLAWDSGSPRMAVVTAVLTLVIVVWRATFRRHDNVDFTVRRIDRIELELAGNSLLAGVLWAAATAGIYPTLEARTAAAHIVVLVGSA